MSNFDNYLASRKFFSPIINTLTNNQNILLSKVSSIENNQGSQTSRIQVLENNSASQYNTLVNNTQDITSLQTTKNTHDISINTLITTQNINTNKITALENSNVTNSSRISVIEASQRSQTAQDIKIYNLENKVNDLSNNVQNILTNVGTNASASASVNTQTISSTDFMNLQSKLIDLSGVVQTNQTKLIDLSGVVQTNQNKLIDLSGVVQTNQTRFVDLSNSLISNILNVPQINANNIFNVCKNACSTIYFNINTVTYSGTGWFFYRNDTNKNSDLSNGYYVTAAHNIIDVVNNVYTKVEFVWIINPITNNWQKIDKQFIYVDGVGDIALIKTNINLSLYPNYALKLSATNPNRGDICYVIGNPLGYDEDSFSVGYVRNNNFVDPLGQQIIPSLFISAPGLGGNSGSPILNVNGDVIGIFTFNYDETYTISNTAIKFKYECFGGGANLDVLNVSLTNLLLGTDYKSKKYLGITWKTPYAKGPVDLGSSYYGVNLATIPNKGVIITDVSSNSPFNGLQGFRNSLLLDFSTNNLPNVINEFGIVSNQVSPGSLIYSNVTSITISFIKQNAYNTINKATVELNKTYNNVNNLTDMPLKGGIRNTVEYTNSAIVNTLPTNDTTI